MWSCIRLQYNWVLNNAEVKKELLHTVKARKLAYYGHTTWKETRELSGERDNTRKNARCMQARKTTHGLDGQIQDADRTIRGRVSQNDKGHEINGDSTSVVWSTLGSRTAKEPNRTLQCSMTQRHAIR